MYWNRAESTTFSKGFWLTLTWDVLKLRYFPLVCIYHRRLTLTWDVLKLGSKYTSRAIIRININMRCIEMVEASDNSTNDN